jgi:type I restriction enzyme M protein
MSKRKNGNGNGKRHATQASVDQAVKSICDIMRRGKCKGAMKYVPELTWILFLRILDEKELHEEHEAEALGIPFQASLESPYRWRDWASPPGTLPEGQTNKRVELQNAPQNALFNFVNTDLLPYLKKLKSRPDATPRQKVVSEIMNAVERVRIDTERNFLDVLDKVHELTTEAIDPTHVFTLSQVYEGLLLRMGDKKNDGGQFFTPRQVITAMVQVIDPGIDDTVYDPSCGTGGFLAQSFEHVKANLGNDATAEQLQTLKQHALWGRESDEDIFPITLANLVIHGIDKPNLWHGNTLTGQEFYGGLFEAAPQTFDVILTNPPFGGKEGKEAQTTFDYKTSATQVLFLQHVIRSLREGGRCGIVLDEGLLFRTNQDAFTKTKRKLLDECDLWCVVSLPQGVFLNAGGNPKTDLLFFTKGQSTRKIWYYDLSDIKVRKKTPMTLAHFEDFFRLLPQRADSEMSWTVDMDERKRVASGEAAPLKEQSTAKGQQAAQWSERLKRLKKARPRDEAAIAEAETKSRELTRESRDLAAKAKEIEDAVYDLKAVNPNKKQVVDTRTPEDLMRTIEEKGKEITDALAELRRTMQHEI